MLNANFISDNFLLQNKYAEALYHDYAAKQPIVDYHCHLPPEQIAENHIFENITQGWLYGDHYKWRAMRTFGIAEDYITGKATDIDKFRAWAKTVPYTLRNPLYHWTHLELKRYFDIDLLLSENTADEIYQEASIKLNSKEYACQELIKSMNVEFVCTTEDPTDSLKYHKKIAAEGFGVAISTAFRPDRAILISRPDFISYLAQLGRASKLEITSFETLCTALEQRMGYFHAMGGRISDHGLDYIPFRTATKSEIATIFSKRLENKTLNKEEEEKFQTALLCFLGEQYHHRGWVQQFHLGALRNNNSRMNRLLGPDTGWDSIGDQPQAVTLSNFLNFLDQQNKLTKTILYNLNPADNEVFAAMIGNFNDGAVKGKIQYGSGWWFLDQKDGIIKQLNALSNMGLISCFIGMLTDSRSFLSYPRHEYFRRILCNLFGEEIKNGELPEDIALVGGIIKDICYTNSKEYFGI